MSSGSPAAPRRSIRMSKLAKFRSRHGAPPKRNPPIGVDVVEYILPGFAAFAATRFATRIVTAQISKRYPKYAKHAGAIASVGAFAAAWFGTHRVKYLDRFHHPIVVGSGLAALQSLIQLYVPKLGWVLGDPVPAPQLGAPRAPALAAGAPAQQAFAEAAARSSSATAVPRGFTATTANEWYAYNDAFDAGSYRGKEEAAAPPVPGSEEEPDMQISDLLDNSDLQLDNDSDMGSFS